MEIRNNKKGFTLLELVVSMSIFSILTLFVMNMYINISRIYLGSMSSRSAQQNIRLSLETMTRYIKEAKEIKELENSGKLIIVVIKEDATKEIIAFERKITEDKGYIEMTVNGQVSNLTSADLNIKEFTVGLSPSIPMIISLKLKAEIQEGEGKGFDKGAGGEGLIEMTTSAALKGQYY